MDLCFLESLEFWLNCLIGCFFFLYFVLFLDCNEILAVLNLLYDQSCSLFFHLHNAMSPDRLSIEHFAYFYRFWPVF
jgi:hypothetical protein